MDRATGPWSQYSCALTRVREPAAGVPRRAVELQLEVDVLVVLDGEVHRPLHRLRVVQRVGVELDRLPSRISTDGQSISDASEIELGTLD